MTTRYELMIEWSLIYTTFCLIVIEVYSLFDRSIPTIKISLNRKRIFVLNNSDIFIAIILIFLTGIRCNCGSDYYNYYTMYSSVDSWYDSFTSIFNKRFQNGYMALCYILKKNRGGEYSIFPIVSAMTILPVFHILRKRTNAPVQGLACWLLLGYFLMTTNIMKQAIAMSLCLLAFDCVEDKKYVRALMFSLFSIMFHSAVIYVSAVFIVVCLFHWIKISLNRKTYLVFILAGCAASVFLSQILKLLIGCLPSRYSTYIQFFLAGEIGGLKLMLGGLVTSSFYIIILYQLTDMYKNKNKFFSRFDRDILLIGYFCIPVLLVGIRYYLFNRIAYFGLQFLIFLIPKYHEGIVMKKGEDMVNSIVRTNYFFRSKFFVFMIVFCVLFSILCAENNYYHYGTIFNESPLSVRDFVNQ